MAKNRFAPEPENDEVAHAYWKMVEMVALSTVGWAKEHGCYLDEKGQIGNFFVIGDRASSSKPHWPDHASRVIVVSEKFNFSRFWGDVLRCMYSVGIPLLHKPGEGWYLGKPGMQGKEVGLRARHIVRRAETLSGLIDAVKSSGQHEQALQFIEATLPPTADGAVVDLERFKHALVDLLLAIGRPVQLALPEPPGEKDDKKSRKSG